MIGSALRIGIHTSISKSLENAALRAVELGANTFQIFSSSPRQWKASVLRADDVKRLRVAREKHDLYPLVVHDSYLINLAAVPGTVRTQSIEAFRAEVERCLLLGAELLVAHPGNGKDQEFNQAIIHVAAAVIEAVQGLDTRGLTLCLEGTAGQGATLGAKLEELAILRKLIMEHSSLNVGYCLDTCHLLAAGYDIASETGLKLVSQEIASTLGWEHVHVIHANDSVHPLGSRLDRHANIGEGYIGISGFRRLLNHPQLKSKPFILETPLEHEGDDVRNVETLKSLCRKSNTTTKR